MIDAPPFAFDWQELHATAAGLLAGRVEVYPQLVKDGKLSQEDADQGIRVMGAVVARFRTAVDKRPIPPDAPQATDAEIVAALHHAAETTRRRTAKMATRLHESIRLLLPILTVVEMRRFHEDLGPGISRSGVRWADPAIPPYLDAIEQLEKVEALLWWAHREPYGIVFCTSLTRQPRERAGADRRKEAA